MFLWTCMMNVPFQGAFLASSMKTINSLVSPGCKVIVPTLTSMGSPSMVAYGEPLAKWTCGWMFTSGIRAGPGKVSCSMMVVGGASLSKEI